MIKGRCKLNMRKIGFIDDEKEYCDDYNAMLKRDGISLSLVDGCSSKQDIIKWIIDNKIVCMLVDYKLNKLYDFDGTTLVAYINSELPDIPCIIITNYCDEGIAENLVSKNVFIPRSYFDEDRESPHYKEVVSLLIQSSEVFQNRLKSHLIEFEKLKEKKDKSDISILEEERFLTLYKLLKAYDEIDDLPSELLSTTMSSKMDNIIEALDKLIYQTK